LNVATADESVGALLATPLVDTVKQATDDLRVAGTVPRAGLWRAQTPQMFRLGLLRDALQRARAAGVAVTDEASAVEALGLQPRLIAGRADNIKLTLPEDLALAQSVLAARN
jgi:2-C-methyl-D-erythritol 4-phosphate cytidylyltransferase